MLRVQAVLMVLPEILAYLLVMYSLYIKPSHSDMAGLFSNLGSEALFCHRPTPIAATCTIQIPSAPESSTSLAPRRGHPIIPNVVASQLKSSHARRLHLG